MKKKRVRRGATLGRVNVSWRWEVGFPLVLIGALIAGLTVGLSGGAVLFWVGVAIAAVGVAIAVQ